MQKRKLKLNILDVTIVILVICAAVALVFRDTINDIISKPEIVVLEVTVSSEVGGENAESIFTVGNTVVFEANSQQPAVVSSSTVTENSVQAVLTCNGYKKLGRYYTENGDLLDVDSGYAVHVGEIRISCSMQKVEITD